MYGVPKGLWVQRLATTPLAYLLTSGMWLWVRVVGGSDWVAIWGQAANDPARVRETCRSYAYSAADVLVESHVVETHAENARSQGFVVLYETDFGDSGHVAHARADPVLYWKIVKETWEGHGSDIGE